MIFILDKQEKVINILKNIGSTSNCTPFFDDILTEDLSSGAETFQFSTLAKDSLSKELVIGNYVAFKKRGKYKLFQIMQTEEYHDEAMYVTVYCECAGLELSNNIFRRRVINSSTVTMFLNTVLEETGWNVGVVDASLMDTHDLELEDANVYSLLQNVIGTFGAEIEFRIEINNGKISKKFIDVYSKRGKAKGKRFVFGENIEGLTRKTDGSELYTALIGIGNDGLSFKDIEIEGINKPKGQDYIEDQQAFNLYNHNGYHIMGMYRYDTDSPEELLRMTYNQLQSVKEPKVEYEINVSLLDDVDLAIGDTVAVVDNAFNPPIQLLARVSKLETSFTNPDSDTCVLSNFVEASSNIEKLNFIEKVVTNQNNQINTLGDKIKNFGDRIYSLENPIYHPNVVYNSNFGRFDENLKPDYWETDGIVTTLEHLVGEYSLLLKANERLIMKNKPIQCFKWSSKSTAFTFFVMGEGEIQVRILADNREVTSFAYYNINEYVGKNAHLFKISNTSWLDSRQFLEVYPTEKTVKLEIKCLSGKVYIDGVSAVPIDTRSRVNINYLNGAGCTNDVMQYRTDDLINAKIGDMWFRGDL